MAGWGVVAAIGAMALVGCGDRHGELPTPSSALAFAASQAACTRDSLKPVTAAPAEGLWVFEGAPSEPRVAAMIGVTQVAAGAPRVTRRIETLETPPSGEAIRHRADSAAVRLDLLPPYGMDADGGGRLADSTRQPAAVYPVGLLVLLAAYEPCAAGAGSPRIRYLRRTAAGAAVTDVMLRRASADP